MMRHLPLWHPSLRWKTETVQTPACAADTGQTGAVRGALDPASGLWGDTKRAGATIVEAFIDGRAARSAEEMRGEFGDAISRHGAERDELLEPIMGYGTRRDTARARTAREEEIMRAILGGMLAVTGAYAG